MKSKNYKWQINANKEQQQELKDMLTPLCAVKHGVGMYRNSLYECRHIKEQQQELIDLKYRYGRVIPGKEN